MSKNRLEAFSDGVIAIIITIMVLELRAPEQATLAALRGLAPAALSYLLSFVFLGIYWNNHHHLLQAAQHVDGRILWANLHLLFWLSLLPFATRWVGATHFAALPVALYGVVFLAAGIAYFVLTRMLVAHHGPRSTLATAVGDDRKGKLSVLLYAVAVPLAFLAPWAAFAVYVAVAVVWLIPDRRIEQSLVHQHGDSPPMSRLGAFVLLLGGLAWPARSISAQATESFAVANNGPGSLPLGTTRGERYHRLVIRGAMVLSGRGTPGSNRAMPPEGPVDIVIENGLIVDMVPMDPVNAAGYGPAFQRPTGDKIIDARGMYVMPGLVEMHAHLPRPEQRYGSRSFDYAFRLYLGHGITTVRDAGSDAGIELLLAQRKLSDANQIAGPKLVLCLRWPQPLRHWDEGNTPDKARAMVRQFKARGADCIKISKSPGHYPDVLEAAVDEGKKLGLFTMVDLKVSETDARVASNAGVKSIEHWYGIPDAALTGSQNFPTGYNYWNELDRFRYAGLLWSEADKNPAKLSEVIDLLIRNGTNWDPTMTVYEDNRDWWRRAGMPVQETLMHPNEVAAGPDSSSHGAFKTEWKTSDEINWKRNFAIWMRWVKTFHERGGVLTAGSDEGGIGGIMLIRELELMQEAGIHPIDVIKVATTNAYSVLGWKDSCGVRVGCRADLAVVNGNPIDNFKVMYGRGYGFYGLVPRAEQWKHGGVAWTIKDGIVFDAQALLREAEWYVEQEKARLKGPAKTVTSGSQP